MPRLAERQREFALALLDAGRAVPHGLTGPDGRRSACRFAVHRNNVVTGLVDALQAAYPATARIVGPEFFRAMARVHALAEQPHTPVMLDYGAGLPEFIERFEPACALPYLADVARIERAWTEAYHAAEAFALDPATLARFPPRETPWLRIRLHPSVRIVCSRFPALTIWRMNVAGGTPAPVDLEASGEDILVARPDVEVEVRALPDGGAAFVSALGDGRTVLEASEAAFAASIRFDVLDNLAGLLHAGVITDVLALPEGARGTAEVWP